MPRILIVEDEAPGPFGSTPSGCSRVHNGWMPSGWLAIPDYALPRLTERCYSLPRLNGGRKSTGLGLNFVQEPVNLHGAALQRVNRADGVDVPVRLPCVRRWPPAASRGAACNQALILWRHNCRQRPQHFARRQPRVRKRWQKSC